MYVKVAIELSGVQFGSEIIGVISNRTRTGGIGNHMIHINKSRRFV